MWDEDGTDKRALSIMIGRKNLSSRLQLIFYCLGRKSQWGGVRIATVVYLSPLWSRLFPALTVPFVLYFSFSMGGLFLSWFILSCCEPLVRKEATLFFMALEYGTRHVSRIHTRAGTSTRLGDRDNKVSKCPGTITWAEQSWVRRPNSPRCVSTETKHEENSNH